MIDHCVGCGADVSDLGGQVCSKCLMQKEIEGSCEKMVKNTIKSAKDKRKVYRRMLKKISEWFKWPSVEKRKYETVLKSFREENDNLRIKFYDATMENATLKDHIERLLEFTELSPERAKEWIEKGKDQPLHWIPVTERLPEFDYYEVLVQTKLIPEGILGSPRMAELQDGIWYCDSYVTPMEEILGIKVVAWFDIKQIKEYKLP